MTTIEHKFINFLEPVWDFETLYIGTFNPKIADLKNEKNNTIDFFYGRPKNLFWDVMPRIHNHPTLIHAEKQEKIDFLKANKIAITDIVSSVSFSTDIRSESEKRLLSYSDSDINFFIPKNDNDNSVSIKMTYFEKIFNNNKIPVKSIRLTRQHPLNDKFIRKTWQYFSAKYPGRVFTLWTPSCWGLPSVSIGLTREDALYKKWCSMLNSNLK